MRLTDQQSLRIEELPADYRVIGVGTGRDPRHTEQVLRMQQNGRLTAATIAARNSLAVRRRPDTSPRAVERMAMDEFAEPRTSLTG